jgi:Zn-dependent metalloprotease
MRKRARCLCSILPGHILRNIAMRGNESERAAALATLAADITLRSNRMSYQASDQGGHKALFSASPVAMQRDIFDAKHDIGVGVLVRSEKSPPSEDKVANDAFAGLGIVFDFYHSIFQRNSIDDEGLHLDATVHYKTGYNNAFWDGGRMVFGDGDGTFFTNFTGALDVIGHELTHGVTGDEINLKYLGESGALNESISDVFGSLIKQYHLKQTADQADWLIGAAVLTSRVQTGKPGRVAALRSMKEPGTGFKDPVLGDDPQPGHMDQYVRTADDNGGVHTNSGIPNRAFYLVASGLGGNAWEKAGRIWYRTLRDKDVKPTASFAQFAQHTALAAGHLFGTNSDEQRAVVGAWNEVGVKVI